MKKIRFDNVVQVRYFNKDDVIKKEQNLTFFSGIKNFLFLILIILIITKFIS